jgi:hypothetical protein
MMKRLPVIIWLTFFAIAMGYLESAVVVYLREIYYPEGFAFPLKMMDGRIALTEVIREAAPLVMLATLGMIAGRERLARKPSYVGHIISHPRHMGRPGAGAFDHRFEHGDIRRWDHYVFR